MDRHLCSLSIKGDTYKNDTSPELGSGTILSFITQSIILCMKLLYLEYLPLKHLVYNCSCEPSEWRLLLYQPKSIMLYSNWWKRLQPFTIFIGYFFVLGFLVFLIFKD
jgi:hypothetical protein